MALRSISSRHLVTPSLVTPSQSHRRVEVHRSHTKGFVASFPTHTQPPLMSTICALHLILLLVAMGILYNCRTLAMVLVHLMHSMAALGFVFILHSFERQVAPQESMVPMKSRRRLACRWIDWKHRIDCAQEKRPEMKLAANPFQPEVAIPKRGPFEAPVNCRYKRIKPVAPKPG